MPILRNLSYPVYQPQELSERVAHLLLDGEQPLKTARRWLLRQIDITNTAETADGGVIQRNWASFQRGARCSLSRNEDMTWALSLEPARAEPLWQMVSEAHGMYLDLLSSIFDPAKSEVKMEPDSLISPLTGWAVAEHPRPSKASIGSPRSPISEKWVWHLIAVMDTLMDLTLNLVVNIFGPRPQDLLISPYRIKEDFPNLDLDGERYRNPDYRGLVNAHQIISDVIARDFQARI